VLLAVFLPILRQEGLLPPLPALAWRPLVASLVMAMAMLIAQRVAGWLAAALIAGPVYAGMLWLLGAIGPEERGLLRRVLGRE
jgi:hypothetical protein